MSEPDISVVLTSYNRRQLLPRAIASVLGQPDAALELIVVDDASQDGTRDYLATLTDSRIRVRALDRNLGPSGARNVGLQAARAPVVAFLDSDDVYLPRRLAAPLAVFAAEPTVVCVLSSARKFDRTVPRDALIPDLKLSSEVFEWALISDLIPVESSSITVRRAPALAAGGFCEVLRRTEDREFLIRLARHGAGRLIPDVLWEKFWSHEGLSADWKNAASDLIAYVKQRPEYVTRFAKIGSYLATKILVGHIRDHHYGALVPDFLALRAAGLIGANLWRDVARHREVKQYRRAMSRGDALAQLRHAPQTWR